MSALSIQVRGHGPIHLVLLHGWAMHGGVFAPLVDALAERCTLHVVDLPGHGRSRDCDLPLEPSACAKAIADATPDAIWLGWSMGGLFALTAALQYPTQVRALALLCSSPCHASRPDWDWGTAPEAFERFGSELLRDHRATVERFLALEAMGSPHARQIVQGMRAAVFTGVEPDPRVLPEGLDLITHTDLRPRLATLRQPSSWIAGARDRLIPWQAMQWSAQQCGGHFTRIEHAGHAPFIGFVDQVVTALDPLLDAASPTRKQA